MVVVNRETVRVDRPEPEPVAETIGQIRNVIGGIGEDPYGVAQLSAKRAQEVRELRDALARDSHDRAALRRAIILKEILDAPLALRQTRPIGG
ncbi:MAG: hypothetical protein K8T26_07430 [Lentisphaerae bacterium]|nr:hypothetical protein [Lentisphaerota bacterium]